VSVCVRAFFVNEKNNQVMLAGSKIFFVKESNLIPNASVTKCAPEPCPTVSSADDRIVASSTHMQLAQVIEEYLLANSHTSPSSSIRACVRSSLNTSDHRASFTALLDHLYQELMCWVLRYVVHPELR
jgi:hypothetical protein